MKKICILIVTCFVLSFWVTSASADPMDPLTTGVVWDFLLDSTENPANKVGNDAAELAWLEGLLDLKSGELELTKIDSAKEIAFELDIVWDVIILKQSTWAYAYLNSNPKDKWVNPYPYGDDSVYKHLGDDYKVSHYSFSGGDNGIPEPAGMFLFGTCIVGLAGVRMRSKKK